jgi:hypothetical protein
VTDRALYVYRLIVTVPPESAEPGWRPDHFEDWPEDKQAYQGDDDSVWRWPHRRLYLHGGAARERARLLEAWGATVVIERSHAVAWSEAA